MGKHFALTFNLPGARLSPRSALSSQPNWGFAVLAAGCLLIVIYLVQVNSFSTKGYEINNLQKKIQQLKDGQKALEVQAAELQSLQRIQSDPIILNMVPVSSINYVQTTSLTQR